MQSNTNERRGVQEYSKQKWRYVAEVVTAFYCTATVYLHAHFSVYQVSFFPKITSTGLDKLQSKNVFKMF